jgi:hypothetical protein
MRRLVLIAVLAGVALPLSATESNPSARQKELAERLITAMHLDRMGTSMIDAMYGEMERQFIAEAEAKGNDPDDVAEAKEMFAAFRERVRTIDFIGLLRQEQARIYTKYFTEQDLADLCAFYEGPAGKKMIEVMPQLMSEGAKAGADKLGPKIQEVMTQVMEEGERKRPWRRTTADMRALATAVEAYQTDQDDNTYPAATDLAGLKTALKDITMSQKFPEKDMWGHPYEYIVSPDRHHYRIVSAGADGIFEWDSRKIDVAKEATTPEVRYRDRLEDDLIYADGIFLQLPVQAKPKAKDK